MLIIADRCGRLGNRLWTFANVVAWGMARRCSIRNPGFAEFATSFPGTTRAGRVPGWRTAATAATWPDRIMSVAAWNLLYRLNMRIRKWPCAQLPDGAFLDLDAEDATRQLQFARVAFLTGLHHIAPDSLVRHAAAVRDLFRPDEESCRRAEAVVAKVRLDGGVVVGVHLRQGDYRTYCDGIMFYTTEEYAGLMRRLMRLWEGRPVTFVVCSDEPQQPQTAFEGLDVAMGPGTPVADLHALALCDYIVGPSSTYSRWASFWGGKPLWRVDWKSDEKYRPAVAKRCPAPADFSVCLTPTYLVDEGRLKGWRLP